MVRLSLLSSSLLAAAFALSACSSTETPPPAMADQVYTGAMVWTGDGFEARDIGVAGDRIVAPFTTGDATETIDLTGRYVTPPIANAHQHITSASMENSWAFFDAGVYYVWNPNLYYDVWSEDWPAFFARPDTIWQATSFGGITEPKSHPEPLYVDNLARYVYNNASYDDMFGSAFHYGRDLAEIEAALDTLKAQGADFVKIYLVQSENYEAPNADGTPNSTTGLNPQNIAGLVERAHARDLPVMAHIETRTDFAVAVDAGVDFLAHLPAYGGVSEDEVEAKTLTAEDIAAAAASGIAVVPTYAIAAIRFRDVLNDPDTTDDRRATYEARRERTFAIQKANLEGLHDAGVPILLGTDLFPGGGSHMEMRHWVDLGALTPLEAARQSFQTGPFLFPDDSVACLDEGCLADFLVLEGNPADDLMAFDSIAMRIKSGTELVRPVAEEG